MEKIVVGRKLPGLKSTLEELKGGKYWDQIIPSEFGVLIFSKNQDQDWKIKWVTRDGKITVVTSINGKVVEIEDNS